MIASVGVATAGCPPDARTQEKWAVVRADRKREMTDAMMQESAPLLKLVDEKVTGVLREREGGENDEWAPLVVRITTESGLVLRLEGTSHDHDGEKASIRAEAISE